ncbi:MAG: hypothetical protein WBW69_19580 [Candidatus Korobacteraceae bacterium]
MVELNDGTVGPQLPADFFASHNFAIALQQHQKNLQRLLLQTKGFATSRQLTRTEIQFELTQPHPCALHLCALPFVIRRS